MKILIAGAGIGGLTAGLCLQAKGHDVHLFEGASALGEIGAGLQLGANAVRVLDALGLREALEAVAVKPEAVHYRRFDTGEVLQTTALGKSYEALYGTPYLHIHRADLHHILTTAFLAKAKDAIHLNASVSGFSERANGISLKLAQGDSIDGDLLVGADGIRSTIRASLLGDTVANWTGTAVWRATIETKYLPKDFMETVVSNFVGPGKHVIVYYLRRKEVVNFVGAVDTLNWKDESWTAKASWDELKTDYEGWAPTIQTLIDAIPRDECYRWAVFDRPPVENWSSDHATLLGDAAHPTLPTLASGAAMAIEDGRILARALEQATSVPEALQLYQRNRFSRTARVVNTSRAMLEAYHHLDPDEIGNQRKRAQANTSDKRDDAPPEAWLPSYDANTVSLV